jgi:hypothetical protein
MVQLCSYVKNCGICKGVKETIIPQLLIIELRSNLLKIGKDE